MPTPYTMKFIIMVWLAFLARQRPVSTIAKPGLHEHDQEAGDQRPDEVDGDLVLADLVDHVGDGQAFLGVGYGDVGYGAGQCAVRIALEPDLGLGRVDVFEIGVGDGDRSGRGAEARAGACANAERAPKHESRNEQ